MLGIVEGLSFGWPQVLRKEERSWTLRLGDLIIKTMTNMYIALEGLQIAVHIFPHSVLPALGDGCCYSIFQLGTLGPRLIKGLALGLLARKWLSLTPRLVF